MFMWISSKKSCQTKTPRPNPGRLEAPKNELVFIDIPLTIHALSDSHVLVSSMPQIELVGDDKANFILFRTPMKSQLMAYLVEQHVLIRDQSKQLNLENCLRITVGDSAQNQKLMNLISTFYTIQETA